MFLQVVYWDYIDFHNSLGFSAVKNHFLYHDIFIFRIATKDVKQRAHCKISVLLLSTPPMSAFAIQFYQGCWHKCSFRQLPLYLIYRFLKKFVKYSTNAPTLKMIFLYFTVRYSTCQHGLSILIFTWTNSYR